MRNGVAPALSEGKLDRPLRGIYLDDQSRALDAKSLAERLVSEDKADVLLGAVSSNGSLAMAPIAERAHVPMITPSATEPSITEQGEYVFRACFVDPFQAE